MVFFSIYMWVSLGVPLRHCTPGLRDLGAGHTTGQTSESFTHCPTWVLDERVDGLSLILRSTNPKINPVQRPTGFKTYCQAIWDTINLTDFVLEIWHALVFFVNYMRGKPGTRGHTTQFQKT